MSIERTFKPGDVIRIVCENNQVDLPDSDGEPENLGNHAIPVGTEFTLPDDPDDGYDGYDNSWLVRDRLHHAWVHEGAMELAIVPVTQDEEDEALASILKALEDVTRSGGSVYLIVRKSHRWMWRPTFKQDAHMYYFAMWWLGIFIGVPRPEKDWK